LFHNCYSLESILIYLLFTICVYLSNFVSLKNGKEKKHIRARADPLVRYIYVVLYVQYLKEWKRKKKNYGLGLAR